MEQVMTARQTMWWPVFRVKGYMYRLDGVEFDIRDLAAGIPHFEAGETVQEHISLIEIACCREESLPMQCWRCGAHHTIVDTVVRILTQHPGITEV